MELKECITCGSHSFTENKCDYCGNRYDTANKNSKEEDLSSEINDINFKDTKTGKLILKIMLIVLVSIIWFAITVFIPPLFIITIILLVVYGAYCLTKRNK